MTVTRFMHSVCRLVLMMSCFAVVAMAQTETATISGLITDDTGAVVPGAEVKLQSVDRGTVESATTNNAGIYFFSSVHPGPYQLSVRKPGFKQVDFLGLIANVQDHIEQNFRLQVGSVAESVTVEASAATINTTDATVSTVVDRQFAENLPMNGRSFQTLIQLTPGVVLTASNYSDGGQFSVDGQRAASNYWTVDGVSANIGIGVSSTGLTGNGLGGALGSFSAVGGTNSLVSVDAMQEFRIQTSTYAPEFGRTPGGQISIVTRSGTNQFHGTAFDYLRNGVLDANNWFADNEGLSKPQERQNDFGGTFSGPIFKDKTFFFFSYEGLRLALPATAITTVPCDNTCSAGEDVRATAAPAMRPFLNAYPRPNGREVFTPCNPATDPTCPSSGQKSTGTAQFNASYSNPASLDAYSMKIDHKLNDRFNLFGRYNYSPSSLTQRGSGNSSLSTLSSTGITTQTATVGMTWSVSSTATDDLRFNYSRTNATGHFYEDSFGGASPLASLPFPSPFTSENGFLQFAILGLTQENLQVGHIAANLQRQINIIDSYATQRGSHALKFGVDFRRLSPEVDPQAYRQDALFRNLSSAAAGSLLDSIAESNSSATFLFRNLGIYAQDTWRITPHLTVTYGLRWDVDFVPQSINGPSFAAVTGFDLNNLSQLALAPTGTPPYRTTYGNFAPRFGLAYQLSSSQGWQTVLRGGVGVYYDLASSEMGSQMSLGSYPFGGLTINFGGTYPLSSQAATPPPITPPTASSGDLFASDPHLRLPYTLEWNVALEQALGKEQTISASYIGAAGRRLLQSLQVTTPAFAFAQLVTNAGTSDYDALQIQFQRRLSRGLQALASYTWSHSIDTGSAGSPTVASNALVPGAIAANRAPSDFDIRNAFSGGLTYELPTPKINSITNAILSGWSVDNIVLATSAPPVDVSDENFFALDNGVFADIRPDLVPGQPLYVHGSQCVSVFGSGCPGGRGFNPNAFTDPPIDPVTFNPLRQGNVPRNLLRGFGLTQWDFAIHKTFSIHESLKLQFRAEMFNVLNHPNFAPPNGGWPFNFGTSTQTLGQYLNGGNTGLTNVGSGAFSPLYQVGGPRSIQVALKLQF